MSDPIYHLARPSDWAASVDEYQPATFTDDGFIHCSTASQLPAVARERFIWDNDLILLTIDPEPLGLTLIYEDLDEADESFPHVYGALPTNAVLTTGPYLSHLEEAMWLDYRYDPEWMDRILHPEFAGIGMSGRTYDRMETIGARPTRQRQNLLPLEGYRLHLVDKDVALARYTSSNIVNGEARRGQRSSIWINTNDGWRLRFHQGTPLPEG